MDKYEEAIDTLKNFFSVDGASCDETLIKSSVESLQELLDNYKNLKEAHEALVDFADDLYLDNKYVGKLEGALHKACNKIVVLDSKFDNYDEVESWLLEDE